MIRVKAVVYLYNLDWVHIVNVCPTSVITSCVVDSRKRRSGGVTVFFICGIKKKIELCWRWLWCCVLYSPCPTPYLLPSPLSPPTSSCTFDTPCDLHSHWAFLLWGQLLNGTGCVQHQRCVWTHVAGRTLVNAALHVIHILPVLDYCEESFALWSIQLKME